MSDPTSPAASPEPETRRTHSHEWTVPLTAEARETLHREALAVLKGICEHGRWDMSVPVREADSDMVFAAVVTDAALLGASVAALIAERDEARATLAALKRRSATSQRTTWTRTSRTTTPSKR